MLVSLIGCAPIILKATLHPEIGYIPDIEKKVPFKAALFVSPSTKAFSYTASIPFGAWEYPFGEKIEGLSFTAFSQVFKKIRPIRGKYDLDQYDIVIEPEFVKEKTQVKIGLTRMDVTVGVAYSVSDRDGVFWRNVFVGDITTDGKRTDMERHGEALSKAIEQAALQMWRDFNTKEFIDRVYAKRTITPKPTVEERVTIIPSPGEKLPPSRPDAYAVAIGIDYKGRKDIPSLQYPSQDAKRIYKLLIDPRYGGVPEENATILLNEKATTNAIKGALRKVKYQEGYVYIYYSGHGAPKTKEGKFIDGYLVPYDADVSSIEAIEDTGIKLSCIEGIMDESRAKGMLIALDACFTGGGKSIVPKGGKPLVGMLVSSTIIHPKGIGKAIITSSASNQQSWEEEKEIKGGIFSHYLLEGLKGKADKDNDSWVTVDEIYGYLKESVFKAAKRLKGEDQNPQLIGKADFAVTRNWARAKVMDVEVAKSSLKAAFEMEYITVKQLNRALDELKTQRRSKTLEAFLKGEFDAKRFGELY